MEFILGIDEAGRGPVLGPMVYGVCWCPEDKENELSKMGFDDSKVLTAQKREELFEDIKNSEVLGWLVDIISPQRISTNMNKRPPKNLNEIAHESTMDLIQMVLDHGVKLSKVFVDTVGPPASYEKKLTDHFMAHGIKFTVAKKADSKYPIVSAASICAKVIRDEELKNWVFAEKGEFSRDFGSGYPSDPKTKKWLQNNCDPVWGFPMLVRDSWQTAKDIVAKKAYKVDWGDEKAKAVMFPKKNTRERHRFFNSRHLETVFSFD